MAPVPRSKGSRLEVRLRPRRSRALALAGAVFVVLVTAALLAGFAWNGVRNPELDAPHRRWMGLALLGGFTLVLIPALARMLRISASAGLGVVEVDRSRLSPGEPFRCFVRQARALARIERLEARLVGRREPFRRAFEELASVPLGEGRPADSLASRIQFEASGCIPDDAPPSSTSASERVVWFIELRARYGPGAPLVEEFELEVGPPPESESGAFRPP